MRRSRPATAGVSTPSATRSIPSASVRDTMLPTMETSSTLSVRSWTKDRSIFTTSRGSSFSRAREL